jgi:hypothetical protein
MIVAAVATLGCSAAGAWFTSAHASGSAGAGDTSPASAPAKALGIYSLNGDATGVIAYEDEPSANAHPEGQTSAPESSTTLSNGPVGYGLSAIGWPGATVGNAGGVVILLFPPAAVTQVVPIPDAVTQAVDSNASLIDYPIRAEARTPHTPDARLDTPAGSLTAHADNNKVDANAAFAGMQQAGAFSVGNAQTASTSTLNGDVGKVVASSNVSDIDIAGVLKIGNVSSTATTQTNGLTSSGSGSTLVTGVTVAGQEAYIDDTGLHIGSQGQPVNAVANQIAQAALSPFGIRVVVSAPQLAKKGPAASFTAGSLIISWTPPGDPSDNVFTISLGGARSSVSGALGSPFAVPSLGSDVSTGASSLGATGETSSAPQPTSSTEAPSSSIGSSVPSGSVTAPSSFAAPARRSVRLRPATEAGITLAKTFRGFGAGWVVLGLVGVGLLFAGSTRLADDVLLRPPNGCPRERSGA